MVCKEFWTRGDVVAARCDEMRAFPHEGCLVLTAPTRKERHRRMNHRKNEQRLIGSRRDFLVQALSLGWLAGGMGWNAPALAALFGKLPGKLPAGKSVFEMKGDVTIDGKPVTKKTVIKPTDKITTGSNSYLIAAVGANSFILRDRSTLDLGGSNPLKQVMRLVSGKFLGVFGKLGSNQQLSLNTPIATIGIRGTGVYAESDPDKTYLCTCYGTTQLAAQADHDFEGLDLKGKRKKMKADEAPVELAQVTAQHHDAPKYILAQPDNGKRITAAPFINHTDLELMTLEALVGRKVPFGLPAIEYGAPRREY
jgi:hypothetical protein